MELLKLFNIACNTETIQNDWQKGVICPIWKTGDKIDCGITEGLHCCHMRGNYTGELLRTDYERMLTASLAARKEWQHGLRPGKSTIDLIFTIKMILEKSWEWGRDKFALFIDMEKALDRVNREALWETISDEYYSILPKLVRIIKNMYLVSSCKLRIPG